MNRHNKLVFVLAAILGLSLLGLAAQFAPSLYNRPITDDLCTAGSVNDAPFFEYVRNDYRGWTGRYSYIAFTGLAALAGPRFASMLPLLLVLSWFCVLVWAQLPLLNYLKLAPQLLYAAALGSFFLAVISHSLPSFFESLVWGAGAINYTMPLVFFTLAAGLLLRTWFDEKEHRLIPIVVLVFICGGFSEIFGLLQIAIFASLIAFLFLTKARAAHKRFSQMLLAALLSALLAFAIVYLAPGNAVRQAASSHPQPTSLARLPWLVVRSTLVEFYSYLIHARYWILPLFLVPFSFGILQQSAMPGLEPAQVLCAKQKLMRSIVRVSLIVLGLALVAAVPSSYIQGDAPVSRAMILFFAFLIPGAGACSFLLGRLVVLPGRARPSSFAGADRRQNQPLMYLALLSVAVGVAFSMQKAVQLVPVQQQFARAWDARDQELRTLASSGVRDAQAPMLVNAYGYSDLNDNPKHWVNRCAAHYYHLETLTKSN